MNERAFGRLVRVWGFLQRKLPSSLLHLFKDAYRLLLAVDNAFFVRLWKQNSDDLKQIQSRKGMLVNPVQDIAPHLTWKKTTILDILAHVPNDLSLLAIRHATTYPAHYSLS